MADSLQFVSDDPTHEVMWKRYKTAMLAEGVSETALRKRDFIAGMLSTEHPQLKEHREFMLQSSVELRADLIEKTQRVVELEAVLEKIIDVVDSLRARK